MQDTDEIQGARQRVAVDDADAVVGKRIANAPTVRHGPDRLMHRHVSSLYRHAWILPSAVLVVIVVCSTPAFAQWLRRGLTGPYPTQAAVSYPRTDAIVVLGGGWMPDTEDVLDNPTVDDAHTRLGFGRRLYLAGRAPMILLSGGDGEAQRMAARLALQGVPPARMWTESRSRDTHENAVYSAQLLRRAGARRVLLVTSAIHMGRAVASFRKEGVEVVPAPSMPLPHRDRPTSFWHGRRMALFRSANYLHEYLGQWVYRLRGWS
ncbi:hypothetical protein B5P43_01300 [Bacillus sp. SRB_336]|nr:hypothetical protein B5P43_01300 [Bacillus sp. SRB_336]